MNEKLLEYFKSDDIHLIQCEHKWCDAYGYEKSQMKKDLLDYITKLQQENERLNNKIKEQNLLLIEFQDMEQKLDIYKLRCEKAIEFNQIVLNSDYVYSQDEIAFKNLNILNGSDK